MKAISLLFVIEVFCMKVISFTYDSTNYYLVESSDGWIMIDTGWPGTLPKYLNLMKQKGIDIKEIKYLIVTHFHPDHAGLVQDFKELGTSLILHDGQVPYVDELKGFFKRKPQYKFKDISPDNRTVSCEESRLFLKEIGIIGEIITTPGHSRDSISLVIDECCAFTGDLPRALFADVESNPDIAESWIKIEQYMVKTIYQGHGYSFTL